MFHVKHRLSFPQRSPACTRLRTAFVETLDRIHRQIGAFTDVASDAPKATSRAPVGTNANLPQQSTAPGENNVRDPLAAD